VLVPFFQNIGEELQGRFKTSKTMQDRFSINTIDRYFSSKAGPFERRVNSDWHQDGPSGSRPTILGLAYGPRTADIPLKSGSLQLSYEKTPLYDNVNANAIQKQRGLTDKQFRDFVPVLNIRRRTPNDTSLVFMDNNLVYHRGTPYDFESNPDAKRSHASFYLQNLPKSPNKNLF
jgi:hypothetical protein